MRRWLRQQLERERARPRTEIDHWIARQREIVLRLPRWLVGSTLFGAFALGVYWAATQRGLWRVMSAILDDDVLAAMSTVTFTMIPVMGALYVLGRVLRPRPPPSVPPARVV